MPGNFPLLNERYAYKNPRSLMKCYLAELNECIPWHIIVHCRMLFCFVLRIFYYKTLAGLNLII